MGREGSDEAGVPGVGDEVEQVVVPTMEMREVLSEAVLVTSSARKVSSDTISLSHWANKCPEGSGREQGGCGSQVCV